MSTLYVAGVSINENPKDISPATLGVIKECEIAVGEERKVTLRLLNAAGSPDKEFYLINEHSGAEEREKVLAAVLKSKKSVFFSDAGTPCISDPDSSFIAMARNASVEIKSLPGPSSVTAAISVSGIEAKTFFFAGFPPREKEKRKSFFGEIASSKNTVVFMERPYSLAQTLSDMAVIKRKISLSINLGFPDEKNFFDTPENLSKSVPERKAPFVIVVPPL